MLKKTLLLFVFIVAVCSTLCAQGTTKTDSGIRQPGQVIVQLAPRQDITIDQVVGQLVRQYPLADVHVSKDLAPRWGVFLLGLNEAGLDISTFDFMYTLRSTSGVAAAQWDYQTNTRELEPNDANWSEQANLRLIGMPQAWEETTGGLTPAGDTIVVAVLEHGMQPTHPDLLPNMWRNWREIPSNNIDDDGNGYIDDYTGYNPRTARDAGTGTGSSHGTSVHGIIGARGDNAKGVAGINWTIKMIPILQCILESEIISGYYYAAEQRRAYNESNGQRGAFVVATNASFGIDNAFAADHPLWCAVYDSLGHLGVLNVASTSNEDVDVDLVGDMPTTCTSEFLITVTNVEATTGRKIESAGYGTTSIDLGAPGQGSFSTRNATVTAPGDTTRYGAFGGTSAACPHVTGTVGLLYSLQCDGFVADAKSNPMRCVRRVRDAILYNTQREATLKDKCTTAGRLNVAYIVRDVEELCAGTVGDLTIYDIRPNPVMDILQIRYQTPDFEHNYRIEVFDMTGRLIKDQQFMPPVFEAKRYELDVRDLPQGIYVVRLSQGSTGIARKFFKM
jgi:Subtilase family/Secretion system C-terminal sorting domain